MMIDADAEVGDGNDDEGPHPWVVMGRVIGTVSGWDQHDVFVFSVYDFVPAPGVDIPPCEDVTLDYAAGTWRVYNDDGMLDAFGDLVEVVKEIPTPCLNS